MKPDEKYFTLISEFQKSLNRKLTDEELEFIQWLSEQFDDSN